MKNNAPHLKSIFLSPAVLPAASFLTAAALEAQPLLPLLLASLGLAFGRRFGAVVVFFALGLLVGHLRSDEPPRLDDLRRPIEIVAEVVSHPQRYDDTVSCLLRVERLLRAREVRRVSFDLRLSLAADLPGGPELCQRGGRLRLRGELRRTAAFANYEGARPGPWRMRLKSARLATVERSPGLLSRGPALLRARIDAALSSHDESIGVALARALLIGDRSGLKIAHQQSLRRFGLAHLLAVSGLHVGLLGGGVFLLASPLPRWARHGLAAAAILLYLMVLGPRPSALRAALMGWWMLTSLLAGRAPHALNSLACGVIVLVSIDPEMLLEPGFQLSVSATAGILLFSPIFVQRWTFLPYRLRQALAVSVAAQISTMPWSLPLTGAVHPLASVMNLLAVPWLTVVLGAAFIFLPVMLSPFSGLTEVLVFMLDFFAMPLDLLLRLPVTPLDLRLFSQNHMAAWILAMALALVALRPRTGGVIFLAGWLVFSIPETKPTVELTVLDVGQGDAIVLQDGTSAILIDGGGWPQGDFGGRVLVPALAAVGVRHVEAVIMTHPDTDHCGGLADLARYVAIGEVLTGAGWDTACSRRLTEMPGVPVRHVSQGDVLFMGRWKLEVIAPFKDVGTRTSVRTRSASLKSNDRSLVLRASAGGRRVLLTGDLEEAGERRLLASGEDLRAEVLKVAHHGSRSSTSRRWLAAVQPRLALISAGEGNAYGHPASGVLQLLEEAGATTLRTDLQGRLHLIFPVSSAASEASNSSAAPEASKLRQRHPRISTPGTH